VAAIKKLIQAAQTYEESMTVEESEEAEEESNLDVVSGTMPTTNAQRYSRKS
jgi:hypothetical protein